MFIYCAERLWATASLLSEVFVLKRILMALLALILCISTPALGEDVVSAETPTPGQRNVPISEYVYTTATYKGLGVRFYYPSHWEYIPGHATVCFLESVEGDNVPGRFAISVKQLSSRAKSEKMESEMKKYVLTLMEQYESYDIGALSTEQEFMGKTGYSTVYRGTKNGQSIRGFAIMACVGTKIYAYHFSCGESDYEDMTIVMEHIRDNINADNAD